LILLKTCLLGFCLDSILLFDPDLPVGVSSRDIFFFWSDEMFSFSFYPIRLALVGLLGGL